MKFILVCVNVKRGLSTTVLLGVINAGKNTRPRMNAPVNLTKE